MKSGIWTEIIAMTLLAALAVSVRLKAQEQSAQDQQQHYSVSGLGSATQATNAVEPTSDSVVPRLIQFSGTVKDAEGKSAVGSVELTFSLYQFNDGGSPLWVETQPADLDSQGRYTVLLGAASPDGLPLDVFTSGAARWLGVQPALPGVGEQPRVLLVGVPYALKAADAETLGGKPASAFMLTGSEPAAQAQGTVSATGGAGAGKSPNTVSSRRDTDKSGPLSACTSVTADGTAKANFVAKFTSACAIHQSSIFENSGKVGIGNTSPGAALDVSGTTVLRNTLNLSQTTGSSVGVINMGGSSFIHACCSSSAENTFVGASAGNFTSTGSFNTATGRKALFSNTSGFENTAIGQIALSSNTSGFDNTATGEEALFSNTVGNLNTAAGHEALFANTDGGKNTATGDSALIRNTTGDQNTAIGYATLLSNTTGSFNTALGDAADVGSVNLINATAIGAFATVGESNALVLGCTAACSFGTSPPNVGIGTATPNHRLESAADANAHVNSTWPIALVSATTPTKMLGMGFDLGLNAGFIEATQGGVGFNTLLLNAFGGNVGIGTTSPDNLLTVNGSADKPGGGSWGVYSDGRLKTVAGTYDAGLDAILKLTPVRYRYKEQNALGIKDGQEHIGFVAQEVEKVIPEAVSRNNRGYLLVNNDPILWTMLNAIKQQQAEIEALTRSAHEKDAQIQKLTEQAQALQKLQLKLTAIEGRLEQVEVKNGDHLALAAITERSR